MKPPKNFKPKRLCEFGECEREAGHVGRCAVWNDAALDARVETVELPIARRLVVHRIGDAVADLEGAIVWVLPVKGSTPEQVATVAQLIREQRAARVVVLPLVTDDAAVAAEVVASGTGNETVRQIIDELLAEVQEQPELVRKIVELAVEEAGL